MAVTKDFVAYIVEQLALLPRVTSRRMFGGVGLYADGLFFALIADDTLYFKVDNSNRGDYEQRGSKPFCPFPDKPEFSMSYFDAPADLLDDAQELSRWARKSVAVALAAANAKTMKKKKRLRLGSLSPLPVGARVLCVKKNRRLRAMRNPFCWPARSFFAPQSSSARAALIHPSAYTHSRVLRRAPDCSVDLFK